MHILHPRCRQAVHKICEADRRVERCARVVELLASSLVKSLSLGTPGLCCLGAYLGARLGCAGGVEGVVVLGFLSRILLDALGLDGVEVF